MWEEGSREAPPYPDWARSHMYTEIPEELARDPWFKIVEFLQQNWAVVVDRENDVLVVFYE